MQFIIPVVIAVCLSAFGYGLYHVWRADSQRRRLAEEALKGPELTLQQLAQYQGWRVETIVKSFLGEEGYKYQCIPNVLRLTNPNSSSDPKEIYVHVSWGAWYYAGCWSVDVVEIAEKIKKYREANEQESQRQKEREEMLDRIRRGEFPAETSTSASESSSPSSS
ncbi:MAG: hypothetical protein AAB345_00115 [Patescibacteria group bacterium]